MQKNKKLILMDLDGVLNTYKSDYCERFIPPVKEGAKEFLRKLSEKYDIKLFTTRNKLLASIWILENDLGDFISGITNVKELCWLFVDDRCIRFDGTYENLFNEIENFKVWYKK